MRCNILHARIHISAYTMVLRTQFCTLYALNARVYVGPTLNVYVGMQLYAPGAPSVSMVSTIVSSLVVCLCA